MPTETSSPDRTRRRQRRTWRRVLAAIGISLSAALALSGWALSTAVGGAPDDDYHLSSMWCTSFSGPDCEIDPTGQGVMIPPPLLVASYCLYHNSQQGAGCQPFLDGTDPREDFAFGHNNPSRSLYPNGFYMVGNLFKTDNIETTVVSIRLFNIAVFLSLLGALWLLLPTRLRITLAWTWPIALLPLGMFLIPSTNPSSWAIIAVGTGWLALLGYLETNGWRSAGLAAVYLAALVLSVSSRVDSILFLGVASVLALWQAPLTPRQLWRKTWVAIFPLGFVIARLITTPGNLERVIGGVNTNGDTLSTLPWAQSADTGLPGTFDWALLWNNIWSVPGLWTGAFGGRPLGSLGWLDTALPQIVGVGVGLVVIGLIFEAVRKPGARKAWSLAAVFGALWVIPVYLLQISGALAGAEFQPRYLVPFMVVVVGTIVLTSQGLPLIQDRFRLSAIAVALIVANAIALHTNLRRYTTGTLVQGFNLNSPREWWWGFLPDFISPNVVWFVGALAFAVPVWAAFVVLSRQVGTAHELRENLVERTDQLSTLSK
ncbi:MAG: DUF2142 domain-containing protein [Candidatus Nanopelagicales bacterium]